MTMNYNATVQPLFSSINVLFRDVAIAVLVLLSSLIFRYPGREIKLMWVSWCVVSSIEQVYKLFFKLIEKFII